MKIRLTEGFQYEILGRYNEFHQEWYIE